MHTERYLHQLVQNLQNVLGENLVGVYQTGSAGLGDFIEGKSDIDIVGVISNPIADTQKDHLSNRLGHQTLPCPAEGLDLVLLTEHSVRHLVAEPAYDYWFATGANWPAAGWECGRNKEMLIFIESCRRHGITLFGKRPDAYFSTVGKPMLVAAFLEMLAWHQEHILDPFHDPFGQNSVLNACRILAFISDGELLSKSAGGKWLLMHDPGNETVRKALSIRSNDIHSLMTAEEITSFLQDLIATVQRIIAAEGLSCPETNDHAESG